MSGKSMPISVCIMDKDGDFLPLACPEGGNGSAVCDIPCSTTTVSLTIQSQYGQLNVVLPAKVAEWLKKARGASVENKQQPVVEVPPPPVAAVAVCPTPGPAVVVRSNPGPTSPLYGASHSDQKDFQSIPKLIKPAAVAAIAPVVTPPMPMLERMPVAPPALERRSALGVCHFEWNCDRPDCSRVHGAFDPRQNNRLIKERQTGTAVFGAGRIVCSLALFGYCVKGPMCNYRHFTQLAQPNAKQMKELTARLDAIPNLGVPRTPSTVILSLDGEPLPALVYSRVIGSNCKKN